MCVYRFLLLGLTAVFVNDFSSYTAIAQPIFPMSTAAKGWTKFKADGFQNAVSGVIYKTDSPPCCGVPLGGISTGCIDVDPIGTFGFCSIFNGYPRQPKLAHPFLGIAV